MEYRMGNQVTGKVDGKKLLQDVHAKNNLYKKEQNQMNKSSKWTIAITVFLTLSILAALATVFYYGVQYGMASEKSKTAEIHAQATELAKITSKE